MALVSKEIIENIRSRCSLVDVISHYLPELRRRGGTHKCCCPFHKEQTPSFTVNEDRQIYHCFGCGAGGDVFRFVMDYEKVDFVTAVKMLAARTGVAVVFEGGSSEERAGKDVLYNIHAEAAAFYHRLLFKDSGSEAARRYLAERDLPEELAREFQIGFAPGEWKAFLRHALKKGRSTTDLETAGLALPSSESGGKSTYYDRFRNRLMFPVCDQLGRVIGFSGRVINRAEKGAKYINSPETPLFRKSHVLFAFDKARKSIVEKRQAIVVEGQIDAIRCHQAGLKNVVASQGTALTIHHARLIKRHADEVFFVFDADRAGVKASLASSEVFVAQDLSVRVATLPGKEDPDSLVRYNGAEALKQLLAEAPAALDYLIHVLQAQEGTSTEAARMRVVQSALNLIRICPSTTRKNIMLQHLSAMGIAPDAQMRALRTVRKHPLPRKKEDHPPAAPERQDPFPRQETALLELLIHHYSEIRCLVCDYLPPYLLTDPVCRTLFEALMFNPPETLTTDFNSFERDVQRCIVGVQIGVSRTLDCETSAVELAKRYILLFWKRHLEREQARIAGRADLTGEARFKELTRLRRDIHLLARTWGEALPFFEARCHLKME